MAWRRVPVLTLTLCVVCLCTPLDLSMPQFPQPHHKGQNSEARGPFQLQHLGFLCREGRGVGAHSAFPLPFLASLFLCYPFISSYPGLLSWSAALCLSRSLGIFLPASSFLGL